MSKLDLALDRSPKLGFMGMFSGRGEGVNKRGVVAGIERIPERVATCCRSVFLLASGRPCARCFQWSALNWVAYLCRFLLALLAGKAK